MKTVVQVKLVTTPEVAAALHSSLCAANEAANFVSVVAFREKVFRPYTTKRKDGTVRIGLQDLVYTEIKDRFGLSAQPAIRVIKKVVDAYTTLHANLKAGNYGKEGSRRRAAAESKPIVFRPDAAQPYDLRCLSWQYDAQTVSIWTTSGRLQGVGYVGHSDQLKSLHTCRKGETDLVHRDGKWFLVATCEVPEAERFEPVDWIGVDRGIVNLATTSDGDNYSGRRLGRYRRWQQRKRQELQTKRTRSANRRLRNRNRREQRHAAHVNHKISKTIVTEAQRTGRGIALEDLGGIRERARLNAPQRVRLSSWPFHQLGEHLAYKALRAGVPFLEVDSAYTSQMCPRCGHTTRNNRPDRDTFSCRRCGLAGPSDHVAGVNVRNRARSAWVLVNGPVPQGLNTSRTGRCDP
ncbi:transposase [Streptomyces sp. SLBN-118]|uniref:RNA-guided endonuclease InsQ/TnpB family protein n=1 Tax=Streptomyces sp. SLBN-118 TaxID=2768454 RepID=UPI0021B1EC39|nr:transposase [Streptomyces sp. SLBN-118]